MALFLFSAVRRIWIERHLQAEAPMTESFDDFLERHSADVPDRGPYTLQPNLTERQAAAWWNSKTAWRTLLRLRHGAVTYQGGQ
jgi:hypothetical protein